ncbi:MAG: hypothetical protein JKX84_02865 [Flavobacteriales bacterium]|nr:hypothetical protein [Flavobacteriales bacterium]
MKFQSEIEIDRNIKDVSGVFGNAENTLKWLEGLHSAELISGIYGEVGAKCKVVFESAAGKMEMTETVTLRNLPEQYATTYEGVGYFSWSNHYFEEIDGNTTRYILEQEVELHGAFKAAGFLLKGTIRRQLEKTVVSFKRFTEAELD